MSNERLSGQEVQITTPDGKSFRYNLEALPRLVVGQTAAGGFAPLSVSPSGGIATTPQGAANLATSQVATSTGAGTAAIARPTRRSVLIRNLDSAITVYVGPATVTSANGVPLRPGDGQAFTFTGLIQVIAASGTPTISVSDEYD